MDEQHTEKIDRPREPSKAPEPRSEETTTPPQPKPPRDAQRDELEEDTFQRTDN
jgi:hypothetical protein